ncbi:MAG: hypothetical protein LBE09_04785 [Christensenellaceae bacterium]|jgi:DNA segregation ATPase FtsK/SpoIIIE-like protein|nr:hypothetical protein [Christensenellaceae bacterium]
MPTSGNKKYYSTKKIAGITICTTSVALALLLILPRLRMGLTSFFGLAIYVYIPTMLVLGVLMALDRKPLLRKRDVCMCALLLVFAICTLHVMFEKDIIENSQDYILATTQKNYTVGGTLISIITYPLKVILGSSYTGILITLFILTALVALLVIYPIIVGRLVSEKRIRKNDEDARGQRFFSDEIDRSELVRSRAIEGEPKTPAEYFEGGHVFLDPARFKTNRSIDEVFGVTDTQRARKNRFTVIGDLQREIAAHPYANVVTSPARTIAEVFGISHNNYQQVDDDKYDVDDVILQPTSPLVHINDDIKVNDVNMSSNIKASPYDDFVDRSVQNTLQRYIYDINTESNTNAQSSTQQSTAHFEETKQDDEILQPRPLRRFVDVKIRDGAYVSSISSSANQNLNSNIHAEYEQEPPTVAISKPMKRVLNPDEEPLTTNSNPTARAFDPVELPIVEPKPKPVPTGLIVPVIQSMKRPYCAPPQTLLKTYPTDDCAFPPDYYERKEQLERELFEAGIGARVISATRGPVFTRYEMRLDNALQVSKIKSSNIVESLRMRLKVPLLEIEAPIKGKDAVGFLFKNEKAETVGLKSIVCSSDFVTESGGITFALGKDIDGKAHIANLTETSHLIVAGATNTGKSVFMNAMLMSIIFKHSPEDVRFIIIDPKRVEFVSYKSLPHMLIRDPITDIGPSLAAIDWLIGEMERRYSLLEEYGCRKLDDYNTILKREKKDEPKLPRILLVVDEMADIMLRNGKEGETNITRLVQKGRAAGIHIVLATQKPTVKIISGLISANVVHRVAFQVIKNVDSRVILDDGGAEELVGRGDMLYKKNVEMTRMQGGYVDSEEIDAICKFVKENNESSFDPELDAYIRNAGAEAQENVASEPVSNSTPFGETDVLFKRVLKAAIADGKTSTNYVVTNFNISYIRARRIIEAMTRKGYLKKPGGNKACEVMITNEEYLKLYGDEE